MPKAPHIIVDARAGTGKSFTLLEGARIIRDCPTLGIEGSPQQQAIWRAMLRGPRPQTITIVAFNRPIAQELASKAPPDCQVSTIHSFGYRAIREAYGCCDVEHRKTDMLLWEMEGQDIRTLRRGRLLYVNAVRRLVSLAKQNLSPTDPDSLDRLTCHYDIEIGNQRQKSEVYDAVTHILETCRHKVGTCVDYDDMIWLPVVNNLPVMRADLLMVDERQDLNKCQQHLIIKAGKRIVAVGDIHQSIYGFAGADVDACSNLLGMLKSTGRGVIELPLTVTRRCGKRIVDEAKKVVPEFEALDSNPEGEVIRADPNNLCADSVYPGDMILCRTNSPLISTCFQLLRRGRKAIIRGRDIGKGLISLIDRLRPASVVDLVSKLDDYKQREFRRIDARRFPSEAAKIAVEDKVECIVCLCQGCESGDDEIQRLKDVIKAIFSDRENPEILLSSVHRAKGLEAKRVYLLESHLIPHPMAKTEWEKQQEENLRYVAITRAIETLTYG